jgi:hypothetical protein
MPVAIISLLFLSSMSLADEWRTPDGKISVAIPDRERFTEINHGPEVLVSWRSTDGKLVMVVGEMANPADVTLNLPQVTQGFLKEMSKNLKNASILRSATEQRNGHDVLIMSSQGEREGVIVYTTQILMTTGGKVYKAIVHGSGIDTRTDPDTTAFIASFRPLVRGQLGTSAQSDDAWWHKYNRATGAFACSVFGMGLMVYMIFQLSRVRKTKNDYDDRPRRRRRRRIRDEDEDDDDRPRKRRRDDEDD